MHIDAKPEHYARAARIMDAVGIGTGIELGSGTLTRASAGKGTLPSEFEKAQTISREAAPGRFVHYMLNDYRGWDDATWSDRAAADVKEAHRLGAGGLKEFKRLGLVLRDSQGKLIKIDDPKLDPVWKRCGELGMPVSIHVADPKAFWEPYNDQNERWEELRDHKSWWFGDPKVYPPRMELLGALERVIERHPQTMFVCVHFGNNPEDIEWIDKQLDAHPNMMIDLAARIPEIGRGDKAATDKLRNFFIKHQDRIFFATDFQVNDKKLILGSSGDAERPTDEDAILFFQKCYRFLETADRDWAHMTPIQGNWTISGINLPPEVLRKVYFDNAHRLLARTLPPPVLHAKKIEADFAPDGKLDDDAWKTARPVRIEYGLDDSRAYPELSTSVRALWSNKYLYVAYEAPYTNLTTRETPEKNERLGLWDEDVVELFVGPDPNRIQSYKEFEWAPNGEQLDVQIDLPNKDFAWTANPESFVKVDRNAKIWRVEARIPLSAISDTPPKSHTRWRANLFRNDRANDAFLAWYPTLANTTHVPTRFGWLKFDE